MGQEGRIFVTGDTHGYHSIGKLSKKNWPEGHELTKKDYLIVAGDFGMLWSYLRTKAEEYWLKWLDDQPWTTLFVDGNHENFNLLDKLQEKELFGDRVGIVSHSIFHLRRGICYRINGQKILTIGGAHSHDRPYRKWGETMWQQEEITDKDIRIAKSSIEDAMFEVDHVITHCAPPNWAIRAMPADRVAYYNPDPSEESLGLIRDHSGLTYGKWWFGHYHTDTEDCYENKWQALYHKKVEIFKGK
jgi:predicted phosphohydrolase